ncbi:MAG: PAS domain S-box protein [Desulfobulbaceae bacterium]|uniref:histidine kinase n=1 Tax=Candidatus Desulfatifera sulfidica TaxID=2841691 RepID=A0A8J6NCC3_9BACT|nr:PAS domain S-box protein [Candidatus Desulfatifera sulfidica]
MKNFYANLFLANHIFTDEEPTLQLKLIFLNTIFLVAALAAFIIGSFRWHAGFALWQENTIVGILNFIFVIFNLVFFYYLKYNKEKIDSIANVALVLSFIVYFSIYLTASDNSMRLGLFFLLLAAVFYLKGRRIAFIWLGIILASIILVHLAPSIPDNYSHLEIFTVCIHLIALFFILNTHEISRDNRERIIKEFNIHLEHQVHQQTLKLRESEALLLATVESLPFDFFVVDSSGRLSMQNSIFRENWGNITGKRLEELSFDKTLLSQWGENNRCAFAGQTVNSEITTKGHTGVKTYHNITSPIRNNNSIIGIVGVNIDITERKRMEKKLLHSMKETQETNHELRKFNYVMARDLKEPLKTISHYTSFLQEDMVDLLTAKQEKYLKELEAIANDASSMIEDISLLTQISHVDIEKKSVDLGALLKNISRSMVFCLSRKWTFSPRDINEFQPAWGM